MMLENIIQFYAAAIDAKEEEMKSFYASLQEEIDHRWWQDAFIVIDDWNKWETKQI